MLELLDKQLNEAHTVADAAKLRGELRRAARGIARDQLEQIREAKDGLVCQLKLTLHQPAIPGCLPLLAIYLVEPVSKSKIKVQANTRDGRLLGQSELGDGYEVSYFDMPMVDYTTVSLTPDTVERYAIVLHDVSPDGKSAEIAFAVLPHNSVSAERRYAFDELLDKFLQVGGKSKN